MDMLYYCVCVTQYIVEVGVDIYVYNSCKIKTRLSYDSYFS